MRFLGFNILTDAQLENVKSNIYELGYRVAATSIAVGVVNELKRLKADHWDKDAFDRLIKFFEENHEERAAAKETITF